MKKDRYEVRLWRLVEGVKLGRDVVEVDATSPEKAAANGVRRATGLRKPPDGVTFEAIDAKLV